MSLINKMLQDLESRKNPQAEAGITKPVYEDLKPLNRAPSSRAPSRRLVMMTALVAVISAGVYAWTQWGDGLVAKLSSDKIVAKSAPPVARKTTPPKPAPAPVVAPAPVAVATVAQTSETQAPTASAVTPADKTADVSVKPEPARVAPPVVAETSKTEVAPVSAAPKKAAPAKSKAAVAKESGYWAVSRGETLYSIANQTGIDLGRLSSWNSLGREPVIHPGQRLRLTPPVETETRQATTEKAITPEKPKTMVASAGTTSIKEVQTGDAVMDKKMKPVSSDDNAEGEYRRAVDLVEKGRMADAEKHLKLALRVSETHTRARELLAGLMLQQGHWRDAQQLLEQGIDKVPAHYPFAQLLARVHVEHGAEEKALTVMEESRRAGASNPDYLAFLAALYQRTGKHAEAVNTYKEAVMLNPREGRSWLGLAISLEAVQDWDNAGAAYQRAIGSGTLDDKLLQYARQRLAIVKK